MFGVGYVGLLGLFLHFGYLILLGILFLIRQTKWKKIYRGADKSLARPGRKRCNASVRTAWISFGALPCRGVKILDDSSRLDVVEIARVPDTLPSLFPSWSGLRTYQYPGRMAKWILTSGDTKWFDEEWFSCHMNSFQLIQRVSLLLRALAALWADARLFPTELHLCRSVI